MMPSLATGTGFVFDAYEPQALLEAIDRALQAFPRTDRGLRCSVGR